MQRPEELIASFESIDRALVTRLGDGVRADQLAARQALLEYVEALWQDVQRAGERPDVGEKYDALAVVRELARSLTTIAFDAVYDRQAP